LIESNAAVDAQKKYEVTTLHLTTRNEHSEIIRILIKAKADVNASDEDH
jgi:ankyrin repeat protein